MSKKRRGVSHLSYHEPKHKRKIELRTDKIASQVEIQITGNPQDDDTSLDVAHHIQDAVFYSQQDEQILPENITVENLNHQDEDINDFQLIMTCKENILRDSNSFLLSKNVIKKEDLNIEEEKETIHCIQHIKQENKDGDEQEAHTQSLFDYGRCDEAADFLRDIKTELVVKEEMDLMDDQHDSFCSSEPSNFRNEMCSVPKFEDVCSNIGVAADFRSPQEESPEEEFKWCSKFVGKACFLCFDDERYRTKESLLQHVKENHCQAKLEEYRLNPEDSQDKVNKVFHMVKSTQDGFSVCIDCYMVFYSAGAATSHINMIMKSHTERYKYHEFRTCCRWNTTFCLQPMIICGEGMCRVHITRSASSLTKHRTMHYKKDSLYWWNRWNMRLGNKGLHCRDPKTYMRSTLCLLDSIDSSGSVVNTIQPTNSANNKKENIKQYEFENDAISDNGDVIDDNIDRNLELGVNKSVKSIDIKDVLSAMQIKYQDKSTWPFSKPQPRPVDNNIRKNVLNNVLSEMQQKFCNTTESSENSLISENEISCEDSRMVYYKCKSNQNSLRYKSDMDTIYETGKEVTHDEEQQPQTKKYLFSSSSPLSSSSTSSRDLYNLSKTADFLKPYTVFRLKDYLGSHTRQQFWEEPAVRRILEGIKNKEIHMKRASKLLDVSYGTLYGRYREVFGYLKQSCVNESAHTLGSTKKEQSIWEEARSQELIELLGKDKKEMAQGEMSAPNHSSDESSMGVETIDIDCEPVHPLVNGGSNIENTNNKKNIELVKSVTVHRSIVVLEKLEAWNFKSTEQKKKFLIEDAIRYKNRISKKIKSKETGRSMQLNERSERVNDLKKLRIKFQHQRVFDANHWEGHSYFEQSNEGICIDSGVKEICHKYGLVNAAVEYTEEDYQNLNNYEAFQKYIASYLAAENPRVPESHMRMLVEAKWCEFNNHLRCWENRKNDVHGNSFPKTNATKTDQNNQNSKGHPDPLAMVQTSMANKTNQPKPSVQRAPYQCNNNYGRRVDYIDNEMFVCARCKTCFIYKEKYENHISKSDCAKPQWGTKMTFAKMVSNNKKSTSSSVNFCSKCKKGIIGKDVCMHLKTYA